MHTVKQCKCCAHYHPTFQASFPGTKTSKDTVRRSLFGHLKENANNSIQQASPSSTKMPFKKKDLKEIGVAIFDSFEERCQSTLGCGFADVLLAVPSSQSGIQKKLSPSEIKAKQRKNLKSVKENIENQYTQSDVDAHFALRQSFAAREKQRLAQHFETPKQAEERPKREKSHVPSIGNIVGDLDKVKNEVQQWPKDNVNWSEKAKEYNIGVKSGNKIATPQNAGQILKEYLKENGIDISQFENEKGKFVNSK